MTTVLDRRNFLSTATASLLSPAVAAHACPRSEIATDPNHAGVKALVYPGFPGHPRRRRWDSDVSGPYVVVFGTGPAGMDALRRLPSLWKDDLRWASARPAPASVHEFTALAIESSRATSPVHRCRSQPGPTWIFERSPIHLAILCCAFGDEAAFARAAKLAAFLSSHAIPIVMVGTRRNRPSASHGEPADPVAADLGALEYFRLFQIIEPEPARHANNVNAGRSTGRAIARAANVFVNFVWSAGLVSAGLFDLYDQLFRAKRVRGCDPRMDGWPYIPGMHSAGRPKKASASDFRTDRWVVFSHAVPGHAGMSSLRDRVHECLRDWQWRHHRWSPVCLSVGSSADTTLPEFDEMCRKMTETCDTIVEDHCLGRQRFHSVGPDRLSVELLAVQLPGPEAAIAHLDRDH